MKLTVTKIVAIEPNAFNGLTKTTILDEKSQAIYLFRKPESPDVKLGDELDGDLSEDRAGKLKFKATPKEGSFNSNREFKADPLKQESIEWQSALKAAVETVRDFHTLKGTAPLTLAEYKLEIVTAVVTFKNTVDRKPTEIDRTQPVEQAELPPIESYQEERVDLDDIPF